MTKGLNKIVAVTLARHQQQAIPEQDDQNREQEALNIINELNELTVMAKANAIGLCRNGGMADLVKVICLHDKPKVRKGACSGLGQMMSNDKTI